MFETTDELLKQIQLGEDSSFGLKCPRYRGNQVNDPYRDSMADELAAMANTANGSFLLINLQSIEIDLCSQANFIMG